MSDFAFSNIVLFIYIAVFVGLPILTICQIIRHQIFSLRKKTVWIAIVIITWPLVSLGSLVFAFKNYKGILRFIPAALSLLLVVGSIIGNAEISERLTNTNLEVLESSISRGVQGRSIDPDIREKLQKDIQVMRSEVTINPKARDLYVTMSVYLLSLFLDGFSDDDFKKWNYVFENRIAINEDRLKEFMRDNP